MQVIEQRQVAEPIEVEESIDPYVLDLLIRHAGQTLTKDQIETQVWGFDADSGGNLVEVYVGRLRRKLNDVEETQLITTVRGIGYRLEPAR